MTIVIAIAWGDWSGSGPRFTSGFSIAINSIRWKFRFTLTSSLIQRSLQNYVHGTTAVLSWYVQKLLLRSDGQRRNYSKAKFPSNLNYGQKKLMKRPPGRYFIHTTTSVLSLYSSGMHIRGRFKSTYGLLNLKALKFSPENKRYTSLNVWVR